MRCAIGIWVVISCICTGCGDDRVPVTKVSGHVTYQGKPLPFGTVIFMPRGKGADVPRGKIQPDGSFELGTYTENDGSPLGEFDVRIVCNNKQDPAKPLTPESEQEPIISLIPRKYSVPGQSGIVITVREKMEPLKIDLW
ncbi:MAG: hypothetical protein Q4D62_12995 [Planctomycetia bacterium]|nr:hypothetical protein [Planctomycetia bacterium]